MDPIRALDQIAEIRQRMAAGLTFRGYRAGATLLTAGYAVVGAIVQSSVLPLKTRFGADLYIVIWASVALVSLGTVALGFALRRSSTSAGPLDASLTLAAVEALVPALVAGAMLTYAIGTFSGTAATIGLLPGLWMTLFSLGLFASRRLLPRAVFGCAGYYLLAGVFAATLPPRVALGPWTMGGTFAVGQSLAAAVLYFTLERPGGAR